MLKRLIDNFNKGIEKTKWFSSVLSTRLKLETAVFKLLYQSDTMNKERDELLKAIGKRVFELKGQVDRNVLKDRVVSEAISGIEKTEKNIDELKQKVAEITRVTD